MRRPNLSALKGRSHEHVHSRDELERLAKLESPQDKAVRQFLNAAKTGDLDALQESLRTHAPSSSGSASDSASAAVVELSLRSADNYGETAGHHAAFKGHAQMLEWILGQDPGVIALRSDQGETLIQRACRGKTEAHMAVVKLLLSRGATIDEVDKTGVTPLMRACYEGNTGMIKFLLQEGANINAQDTAGSTVLHWASLTKGTPEVVRILIARGADPAQKNNYGETAADNAQTYCNSELEEFYKNLSNGSSTGASTST